MHRQTSRRRSRYAVALTTDIWHAETRPPPGPCMHLAPLDRVMLGPDSIYRFRYWLIVGDEASIAMRLDSLIQKHSREKAVLTQPRSLNPENDLESQPRPRVKN